LTTESTGDDYLSLALTLRQPDQNLNTVHLWHNEVNREVRRVPLIDSAEERFDLGHEAGLCTGRFGYIPHRSANLRVIVKNEKADIIHGPAPL
jgi:hypothetical protein